MTIEHVFVLMLENRSFDHMFGLSGIPGIQVATSTDSNTHDGQTYHFGAGAPDSMPSDPLHEFCDVLQQLTGKTHDKKPCQIGTSYPARDNSGFVANYATTTVRAGLLSNKPLPPSDYGKIMQAIDPAVQAPATLQLARSYALCDNWFSSLPGPTWPNRFFVHGASSDGLDDSPKNPEILKWEALDGFTYPHGSIYDALGKGNYSLFRDDLGPLSGQIPQVAAIKGLNFFDVGTIAEFEAEVGAGNSPRYTFIEPAYGDLVFSTYRGGSSQHPMDGLARGDQLVARVYNAVRNSPLWPNSLLIITYDEHGGFYDSGSPSQPAPPPGDGSGAGQNANNFDFSEYGVRVPAIIVSPWIAAGTVDHTLYDHASVLATVEKLFGIDPLTDRDAKANTVLPLIGETMRPDADCPKNIAGRVAPAAAAVDAVAVQPADPAEPIEEAGDLAAFLFVVRKADRARTDAFTAATQFQAVRTRGDAAAYLEEVMPRLEAMRVAGLDPA